jgi:hypothetical protein
MIFTVLSRASNPLRSGVRGAWCHFSALQRASCSSDVERTRGDLNTTPLCERPARAVLNAAELLAARQACRKENKYYADTCTDEDAPSEEELNVRTVGPGASSSELIFFYSVYPVSFLGVHSNCTSAV